ncbi:unnamed protein product [Musa hybrid cultivar]
MMECNKEEAIRAREVAEKKMQSRDFIGALKISRKAQHLFPELENISQMLTVCEVHCSADAKINGEMDWYGILQVEPTADDSSIKKQYRKLALLLHPDKNQFAGAEAAFKLIGEAHKILSDRLTRQHYDVKMNVNIRTASSRQPAPQMRNSFYARSNFSAVSFNGLNQQQQQPSAFATANTFWTICPNCSMRYQYYLSILNKTLRCQHCSKPFIAYDLNAEAAPSGVKSGQSWNNVGNSHHQIPVQQANNVNLQSQSGNASSSTGLKSGVGGGPWAPFGHGGGPTNMANMATDDRMDVKGVASNEVQFEEKNPRQMNEGGKTAKPSTANANLKRSRKVAVESSESDSTDVEEDIAIEVDGPQAKQYSSSSAPRRSTRLKQNINYSEVGSEDDDDFINSPSYKKWRGESSGSADGHAGSSHADTDGVTSSVKATEFGDDKMENIYKDDASEKQPLNGSEDVNVDPTGESKLDTGMEEKLGPAAESSIDSRSKTSPEHDTLTYPDPEFYDFEKLRHVNKFSVDQIWALYDNLDGMPRFYARIRHVHAPHFKLRITWLEHNPLNEVETAWSGEELPVGCGNYILGSTQFAEDHLMFSHIVSWEKGKRRNSYDIYPRKGEVWALFKDWNAGWRSDAGNHRLYKYEVIEVLSDFAVDAGISVIPLVKIEGFVSLFMRAKEMAMAPYMIPPNEILRFSHGIPSYRLNGTEKEGIPQGCLELDPASLPTDFSESFPSVSLGGGTSGVGNLSESHVSCFKSTDNEVEPGMKDVTHAELYQAGGRQQSEAWKHAQNDTKQPEVVIREEDRLDAADIHDNSAENENSSPMSSSSPLVVEYPEAEFHNFDEGKSIENVQRGQIWALYSEIDQYPNYYGWVKKIELEDHKVHIAWLEACPVSEEEAHWIQEGMPVACGTFKVEQQSVAFENMGMFSHLVQAKPSARRNRYDIRPCHGEIWAVYKNWSAGWSRSDWQNCEYDVVEISECTDAGLKVRVLTKVDGYRAVFKHESEGKAVTMDVPVNEYIRFSHKIPSFRLTNERGGKLRGYWELDTASIPDILLISDSA